MLLNNKSHGLLPPGEFSSLSFDQAIPYYSQRHLADRNAIYFCIDKIVPDFLDVIQFQLLDVAIFVVVQLNFFDTAENKKVNKYSKLDANFII